MLRCGIDFTTEPPSFTTVSYDRLLVFLRQWGGSYQRGGGGVNLFADISDTAQTHQKSVLKKEAAAERKEKTVEESTSGPASTSSTSEPEDYGAQLRREQKESAKHYLKSYRTQILVCWGALAYGVIIAFGLNTGVGMLLALPPLIYLTSIYNKAYSQGHMGLSRGQAFSVVFLGIPLVIFFVMIAIGLI